MTDRPTMVIIGAGPVGLDAALAATEAGFDVAVYEAGARVGAGVAAWGHVRLFTPWSMSVSPRMRAALAECEPPAGEGCPTGAELVDRVLEPIARVPSLRDRIRLSSRVLAVSRDRLLKNEAIGRPSRADHPFRLLVETGGEERVVESDIVLDCSGSWGHPNWLGAGGIPAPGERAAALRIVRHIPDPLAEPERWRGRRILLVGAGHSAQTVARDLAELAMTSAAEGLQPPAVAWAVRSLEPTWGAVDDDPLPGRAGLVASSRALASGACAELRLIPGVVVERIDRLGPAGMGDATAEASAADPDGRRGADGREGLRVELRHLDRSRSEVDVDIVVSLTGSVGDASLYRQLQVHECWATSGPMKLAGALLGSSSGDCLAETGHGVETLINPEPNFFVLGSKSYGRNNTFLLRIGWEQVNDVIGLLAGVPVP